jgi:hypothetical protein
MTQAVEDASMQVAMHETEKADCCGGAATLAKTGKSCNMGAVCHVEGQAVQSVVVLLTVLSGSSFTVPVTHLDPASWDPSFVWRPPALI